MRVLTDLHFYSSPHHICCYADPAGGEADGDPTVIATLIWQVASRMVMPESLAALMKPAEAVEAAETATAKAETA